MAAPTLTINSTFKLPSGYEIPLLGFGVCLRPGSAIKTGHQLINHLRFTKREHKMSQWSQ